MGTKEKDLLEILEQLTVIVASVAVTTEIIVKELREARKSKEDRPTDEEER